MAQRRARSADERAGPQEELVDRLVVALRELRTAPVERPETFKAPQFDGESDVELFIQHFTEVAMANRWTEMATLLHLREALQGGAKEYGRSPTIEAIFTALRGRYGVSIREARSRLSGLRKEARRSLHDHAVDVEKLVRKAFGDLPEETQESMMLDTFCSSLGHAALQRHLLAIRPENLTDAVTHGNEYLQIKGDRASPEPKVRVLGEDAEEVETPEQSALALLTKTVQQLASKVEALQQPRTTTPKENKCWGCHQTGHTRKDCKTHPWPKKQAGNESGPQ